MIYVTKIWNSVHVKCHAVLQFFRQQSVSQKKKPHVTMSLFRVLFLWFSVTLYGTFQPSLLSLSINIIQLPHIFLYILYVNSNLQSYTHNSMFPHIACMQWIDFLMGCILMCMVVNSLSCYWKYYFVMVFFMMYRKLQCSLVWYSYLMLFIIEYLEVRKQCWRCTMHSTVKESMA